MAKEELIKYCLQLPDSYLFYPHGAFDEVIKN